MSDAGAWSLSTKDTAGTATTLASGTVSAPGTGTWHTLSLGFNGSGITAKLDGRTLKTVTDTTHTAGQVGFGVVGYQTDQFDNLVVTSPGGGTGTGPITSGLAGKCLGAGGTADGTPVVITTCATGDPNQQWAVSGGALQLAGKCLDVTGRGTADGVKVELWTCNGGTNQQWTVAANSSLVGTGSGKCLDDPGASTVDGTQQDIFTCDGSTSQVWHVP